MVVSSHKGKELDLMLAGTKPMAMFSQEPGISRSTVVPDGFDWAVTAGRLVSDELDLGVRGRSYFFAQPAEAWRISVMREYGESGTLVPGGGDVAFNRLEHQQFLGFMLGYGSTDTHAFVRRNAVRMHEQGALAAEDMLPYLDAPSAMHTPPVVFGSAGPADRIDGHIVLRSGEAIALSVLPRDQWRAKALSSALNGVTIWKRDLSVRADVVRLLEFLIEPRADEVEVLMAWAERTVP